MEVSLIREKFEKLYDAESDAVFRYCLTRTSSRETALDLTQDTFFRLWNSLVSGKQPENERAFLFTISRNLVIDWYRAKKTLSLDKMMTNSNDEESDGESFFAHDGKGDLEMEADARLLVGKIKLLKPMYQQVVYLRYVEEMKPSEIAEIVGESPNTVSVRINRGMEELKKIYDGK
jgi:RNA polymerase sigma-70 factor (ECF subfamily)